MKTIRTFSAVIAMMLTAMCALATIHYVVPAGTPGVNPAGDFTSWETAATNIQDAVSAAGAGDLVLVTNGVHTLTNQLVIKTALTLRSFNEGATDRGGTVIDGGYPARTNRCIFVDKVVAVIDGFTITNGFAPAASVSGRGAGVYLSTQGVVSNCVIAGNEAVGNGGGVYMDGGVVVGCTIVGNVATNSGNGGGLYANAAGLVTNCLIRGNCANNGGGVYLNGLQPTIGNAALIDCDVRENVALVLESGQGGGGVYQFRKSLIADCRVVSNTFNRVSKTPYGAGIYAGEGGLVRDCLVAYNDGKGFGYGAGMSGVGKSRVVSGCVLLGNKGSTGCVTLETGGLLADCLIVSNSVNIFLQGGTLRNCLVAYNTGTIRDFAGPGGVYQNCTIVGNSGGIEIGWNPYTPTSRVENCIVYHNGTLGVNFTTAVTAGIVVTNSCILPDPSGPHDTGVITADPRMADLARGDFRPRGSSPCVDAGVWRDWMEGAVDADGRKRVIGAAVDLGVYEYMPRGSIVHIR